LTDTRPRRIDAGPPTIVPHPDSGTETDVADHTNAFARLFSGSLSKSIKYAGNRRSCGQGLGVHDLDHVDLRAKLNAYSAGALSDVEWLMVRTHLSECEPCRAELGGPEVRNHAAPQWISPTEPTPWRTAQAHRDRSRPGWSVVIGVALVVALVAFGIGYALGVTA
jgi:putative zinc finger protein